jgi:hypothetical protein
MPRRAKKVDLRTTLLSGVPEHAKDLFAILEMRSLTPDYFERFTAPIQSIGFGKDDTWTFALLHDTSSALNSAVEDPGVLVPVVLVVSDQGVAVLHETSLEVLWHTTWGRTCRIDLKAYEAGEYQLFALSYFVGPMSVSERFSDPSAPPLDRSEIGIQYFYTHTTPSTYEEIDQRWAQAHISQDRHRLPELLT